MRWTIWPSSRSTTSVRHPRPGTATKVSNGELLVANGDVQMNLGSLRSYGSKFNIFFPAMPDNSRTTVSLPYVAGLAKGAPQRDGARKLLAFLISDDAKPQSGRRRSESL